jgi:hypothetical protein
MMSRVRDSRAVVEAFILRARRVMSHSLVREHGELMREVADGTMRGADPAEHEDR